MLMTGESAGLMIEAKNVRKSYKGRVVLSDMSLQVRRGETLVIIGRSGCGKSVFLKHTIGLIRPDSGEIRVDGVSVAALSSKQMSAMRMRFGMVFQAAALFD